jgi:hypothetical protein
MRIRSRVIFKVLVVSIAFIAGCLRELPTVPANYEEGNCVGTVKDKAGSPVAGASLMLVPEGYSPLLAVTGRGIDSTTSDEYGRYGFTVDTSGAYNLLAKGNGLYAMRKPIRISANARVILDDEILLPPGSLTGTVHLQGAADHRGAIILLMGTNVYAKPVNSSGAFSIAVLAEGLYTLRIITAENDYVAAETTVTVASGMQTNLPCIELQKKFVPVIESLAVAYDPVMIKVVLTWPALDTAKITHYAVYCNRSITNMEPVAVVNKSTTTRSFDILTSPFDTLLYEISAIGNDGVEGPSTPGNPIVKYSAFDPDTIRCAVSLDPTDKICFDREDNFFVVFRNKILKLDSTGKFLCEFVLSDTTTAGNTYISFDQLRIDTAGNIYALVYIDTSYSIVKLTNDLQLVRELVLGSGQLTIAVSAAGDILVHCPIRSGEEPFKTRRRIYDPRCTLVKTDSISEWSVIFNSIAFGDTTVCLINDTYIGNNRIVYYDPAFMEISLPVKLDLQNITQELSASVPADYVRERFYLSVKNLFAVQYYDSKSPSMLLFFNDRLQPVARVPYNASMYPFGPFVSFSFDRKGNCYFIPESDEYNTILKFSVAKALQ